MCWFFNLKTRFVKQALHIPYTTETIPRAHSIVCVFPTICEHPPRVPRRRALAALPQARLHLWLMRPRGSFIICPSAKPQWGPGLFEPVFSPQDLCSCCSLPVKLSPQTSRLVLPPSASSAGPLPGPHHPVFLHLTPPSNCSFYEDRDLVLLVAISSGT